MRIVAPTTLDLPFHPSRLSPRSPPPNSVAWNFAVLCATACTMGREMSVGERSRVRGVSSLIRIVPVGAAIWRGGYWREVRRSSVFTEKEAAVGAMAKEEVEEEEEEKKEKETAAAMASVTGHCI
ncbi:hypothetical protein G5I_03967 [Acromyrmex echinatior]|uniref:Uncharacterized protein n=1 Tax=Acromyrmex echinatior TaxID=103372 RepID=F4WEG1_ACREC|nr:hypothetical protein G5I_03967 [Acromyrmex echinatior]